MQNPPLSLLLALIGVAQSHVLAIGGLASTADIEPGPPQNVVIPDFFAWCQTLKLEHGPAEANAGQACKDDQAWRVICNSGEEEGQVEESFSCPKNYFCQTKLKESGAVLDYDPYISHAPLSDHTVQCVRELVPLQTLTSEAGTSNGRRSEPFNSSIAVSSSGQPSVLYGQVVLSGSVIDVDSVITTRATSRGGHDTVNVVHLKHPGRRDYYQEQPTTRLFNFELRNPSRGEITVVAKVEFNATHKDKVDIGFKWGAEDSQWLQIMT